MIWLNGVILPETACAINATDRGFTLGDGLFETIRVESGVPRFLERHLARLAAGAEMLAIPLPEPALFARAIAETLSALGLQNAALRLTVTRGPAPRGILPPSPATPTIMVSAGPLPPPLKPARLIISKTTRRNEFSPLSRIKSLNYLDSILARQEAEFLGADDALLLNTRGVIAEATASTFFVRIDGILMTPLVSGGALPGIFRALMIERAGVVERSIPPKMLQKADAAFLGNALGVRGIAKIGDVTLRVADESIVTGYWARARTG